MFLKGKQCVALEKPFPGILAPAYSTTKGKQSFQRSLCVGPQVGSSRLTFFGSQVSPFLRKVRKQA